MPSIQKFIQKSPLFCLKLPMLQIKRHKLPAELNFELISAVPFNFRWSHTRVSWTFDHFIFKRQELWIKKYSFSIGELNTAVDRLFHVVEHFPGKKLLIMFKRIARHFKVDWFIGYEDMKLFKHYTFTMFCFQIDKIQKGVATHCDSAIDDAAAYFDLSADEYDENLF